MRSGHANKKGEIYWQCAKQAKLKCSGAARSGLDAANLVEIRPHNHSVDGDHLTLSKVILIAIASWHSDYVVL